MGPRQGALSLPAVHVLARRDDESRRAGRRRERTNGAAGRGGKSSRSPSSARTGARRGRSPEVPEVAAHIRGSMRIAARGIKGFRRQKSSRMRTSTHAPAALSRRSQPSAPPAVNVVCDGPFRSRPRMPWTSRALAHPTRPRHAWPADGRSYPWCRSLRVPCAWVGARRAASAGSLTRRSVRSSPSCTRPVSMSPLQPVAEHSCASSID